MLSEEQQPRQPCRVRVPLALFCASAQWRVVSLPLVACVLVSHIYDSPDRKGGGKSILETPSLPVGAVNIFARLYILNVYRIEFAVAIAVFIDIIVRIQNEGADLRILFPVIDK